MHPRGTMIAMALLVGQLAGGAPHMTQPRSIPFRLVPAAEAHALVAAHPEIAARLLGAGARSDELLPPQRTRLTLDGRTLIYITPGTQGSGGARFALDRIETDGDSVSLVLYHFVDDPSVPHTEALNKPELWIEPSVPLPAPIIFYDQYEFVAREAAPPRAPSPSPNAQNWRGQTALAVALERGDIARARTLLATTTTIGAPTHPADDIELHWLARQEPIALDDFRALATRLVAGSAHPLARNKAGLTLWDELMGFGLARAERAAGAVAVFERARVLVDLGVDPRAARLAPHQRTLVHVAAEWGQVDFAQALATRGLSFDTPDDEGMLPAYFALFGGRLRDAPDRMRVADFFLDHTSDINHRDRATRGTLLLYAAKWQEPELVEKLLRRGARTDIKDWEGRTALDRVVDSENCYLSELTITKQDPSQHAGLIIARRIKKLLLAGGSATVAP